MRVYHELGIVANGGPHGGDLGQHLHRVVVERVELDLGEALVPVVGEALDQVRRFALEDRAVGVGGHAAAASAEQSPDRLTQRLTFEVPQRDIEGTDCPDKARIRVAAALGRGVHRVPEALHIERTLVQQNGR